MRTVTEQTLAALITFVADFQHEHNLNEPEVNLAANAASWVWKGEDGETRAALFARPIQENKVSYVSMVSGQSVIDGLIKPLLWT